MQVPKHFQCLSYNSKQEKKKLSNNSEQKNVEEFFYQSEKMKAK